MELTVPGSSRWILLVAVTLASVGLVGRAQEPIVRPAVAFDVASVKPDRSDRVGWSFSVSDQGRVDAPLVSAYDLIR